MNYHLLKRHHRSAQKRDMRNRATWGGRPLFGSDITLMQALGLRSWFQARTLCM